MNILKRNLLVILLGLSLLSIALPPDMQADRYLIQVEKALKGKDKDYKKAAKIMDKIMALKDKNNLELPIEFYFKYAHILLESRTKADDAFSAINHYLTTAGKSGANYAKALGLYDKAIFWQLVQAQNVNKVKQLIESGADVHAKNKYEATPLHYASQYNENPAIITALIEAGADVNARNYYELTPLHYTENPEIIKALIVAGADVNAKNKDGRTPLFAALYAKNPETIKALIAVGADVNIKDKDGSTPHDVARRNSKLNSTQIEQIRRWLENPSLLR